MHTARIPPVDPAPATITAVLAMHAGHICPSSEPLIRPRLSALPVPSLPFSRSLDVGFSLRSQCDQLPGGHIQILMQLSNGQGVTSVAGFRSIRRSQPEHGPQT
jgi:hypothetical protein